MLRGRPSRSPRGRFATSGDRHVRRAALRCAWQCLDQFGRRGALLCRRRDADPAIIAIPEVVANCCFGGAKRNRLFICGTTSLYGVYLNTRGVMRVCWSRISGVRRMDERMMVRLGALLCAHAGAWRGADPYLASTHDRISMTGRAVAGGSSFISPISRR